MDLSQVATLIADAERNAPDVQPVLNELESTIAALMDAITTEADQQRKMAMVALEYRGRMVRQRWIKQGRTDGRTAFRANAGGVAGEAAAYTTSSSPMCYHDLTILAGNGLGNEEAFPAFFNR